MPKKHSPDSSLLAAILASAGEFGSSYLIAEDASGGKLTYRQLLLRGLLLSRPIGKASEGQSHLGMLLPSSLGAMVSVLATHMLGKTPCMLNATAGLGNIRHACSIAEVKTIFTSRQFAKLGGLEELMEALEKNYKLVYLEDIREGLTLPQKLCAAAKSFFPACALAKTLAAVGPDDVAVVLYTSGSEGTPKGVALSHRNILTNIEQVKAHLEFTTADIMFNPLPVFHSFGLSVGVFLPLILGIRTFLYPSPLHYKQIPPLVKKIGATIFLGTDTFYQGYARTAEPDEFATVRLAVAGAEKLKESTRLQYKEKFGIDIFQGYGVTETSPVISVNTPDEHKPGTVGRAFYGIECKIEPVEGIARGGELFVKGDNVMLGYLKTDKPGVIQPQGEWYDTGDIVDIDAEGYITILGRAKRFAKIGGEMVSLAAVEELAAHAFPDIAHAAIAIPDERKGEQIVLYTEGESLTREELQKSAKELGLSELYLPRQVKQLDPIPRLGNGKIDYIKLKSV